MRSVNNLPQKKDTLAQVIQPFYPVSSFSLEEINQIIPFYSPGSGFQQHAQNLHAFRLGIRRYRQFDSFIIERKASQKPCIKAGVWPFIHFQSLPSVLS